MIIQKLTERLLAFIFLAGLLLSAASSYGQTCTATTVWTLDPPPVNDEYEAGQDVDICCTISGFTDSGAGGAWLHGITLTFPDGWDVDAITDIVPPTPACSGNGFWAYYESIVASATGQTWGPGFYYETAAGNGFQDTNPGNNWGNICTGGSWTFCFTITLDAECGGPGNPFDQADILPEIFLSGDGITGSWGSGQFAGCATSPNFAQTPPITVSLNCCDGEPGVSPGTLDICNNGIFDLYDELGAPVQDDGFWTDPAGSTTTDNEYLFDPLTSDPGDYTYTVTGSDGCLRTSVITMEFIDLGNLTNFTYCGATPTTIASQLGPSFPFPDPTFGGTWTDPNGIDLVGGNGPIDPNTSAAGTYTYNFNDPNNCPVTLTIGVGFAGGTGVGAESADIQVCTISPPFNPLDSLGGTPLSGLGASWVYSNLSSGILNFWTTAQPNINPANFNNNPPPTPMVSGYLVYYYGQLPCSTDIDTLFVTAFPPVDAGDFTVANVCVTDPPFVLETILDGTPTPGLTWSNTADPTETFPGNALDPSNYTPNTVLILQYSGGLEGTECFSTNLMQITILPADANAGDFIEITLCESDPVFCLTDFVPNAQAGGSWVGPTGNPIAGCTFNPATSPSGTYTYTVTTTCDSDSQDILVTVIPLPSAGLDGTLNICENDVNIPLFIGLNGSPDTGGIWTLGGVEVGPNVSGATVTNGAVYTYLTGTPTCNAFAQVTINLQPSPSAGTATTAPQLYCDSDPAFSLFTLLATPPSATTGTWSGPGGFTGATLNPATAQTGTYTYTLNSANCGADTESIDITIEDTPNAGNSVTLTLCPNATGTTNLFTALGGGAAAGGTWISVPAGGPTNGIFSPGDPAGAYVYEVSSPSGSCTSTATVTVNLSALPNAGTNGSNTVCTVNAPFTLISQLGGGPALGGFWTNPSGNFFGGAGVNFNPAIHPSGNYTYSLTSPGCPPVTSVVTVTVLPVPNAGNNNAVTLCENLGSIDLTSYLGGTPNAGGTWSVANPFDISALAGSTQTLTYTVDNGTCDDSADLTLTVEGIPNAGGNGSLNFCADEPCFNLSTGISGAFDAGGVWTNSVGATVPNNQCPTTLGTGGVFTYTLDGNSCPDASSTVNVSVVPAIAVTGVNAACQPNQLFYVVQFNISGGTPPYLVNGSPSGANFTSTPIAAGTPYSFTVSDAGSCSDEVVSGASPNCVCPASAIFDNASANLDVCLGGSANLEFNFTGAGPFDVVLNDGVSDITFTGITAGSPVINVTPAITTTYSLVSVSDQNCTSTATGDLVVVVETPPNAGPDVNEQICSAGGTLNLTTILDPGAQAGGTFTNSAGATVTTVPNTPASSGVYTYTVPGAVCPADQATYILEIYAPLSITGVVNTVCNPAQTAYTVSFTIAGGTGNYTVNGTGIAGNTFTSALIPAGTNYSFDIGDDGPCANIVQNGASPACICPADADFITLDQTICLGETVNLQFNLSGAGPFTVVINDGTGDITIPGIASGAGTNVTPLTTTTYSLVSVDDQNCNSAANGSVTITVETPPNAGPDVTEEICSAGGTLNLNTLLDAGAQTGGTFTNSLGATVGSVPNTPASSGVYTYTVSGTACTDDAATYTIDIYEPLSITGAVNAVCNAAQTDYTVSFTISGGTGNYTVDGAAVAGNTFTSAPIPTGTAYSFDIADDGPCANITQSGASPNCLCPATASFAGGNQNICAGSNATLTLNLSGAGPFDVTYTANGTPTTINAVPDGHTITVSPTANTTYVLTGVVDQNCTGNASGSITVNVETPPNAGPDVDPVLCGAGGTLNLNTLLDPAAQTGGTFTNSAGATVTTVPNAPASSGTYTYTVEGNVCPDDQATYDIEIQNELNAVNVVTSCNAAQTSYTVSFEITGGNGNYNVNGAPVAGNTFTSAPIAVGTPYSFDITDNGPCGTETVAGNSPNCSCPASAALTGGNQTICVGSSANLPVNLQGAGPWIVVYTDGTNNTTVTLNTGGSITVSPTANTTYSLVSVEDQNCAGSVSGNITVNVDQPGDAGPNVTELLCGGPGNLNLNTLLSPLAEVGGNFFNAGGNPVAGNSVPNTAASSGVYTYTVDPNSCPASEAQYNITINNPLVANAIVTTCNLAQTEYTVGFSISGGSGTYTVNGNPIPGNTFTSALINATDGYLFTIDDNGPCASVEVSGDSPDCSCLAEGSISGSTSICQGSSTNLVFDLTGIPPFTVLYQNSNDPANPITLNNVTNGQTVQLSPTANSTYTLLSVSDANCTGTVVGDPVVININSPVVVNNVTETCSDIGDTYTVTFNVTGGVAPIVITPAGGNFNAGTGLYTSAPINSGSGYNFTVNNAGACPAVTVNGAPFTCPCVTDAGTLQNATLVACTNETVSVLPNIGPVLDGNDTYQFALHNGTANSFGTVLILSDDANFGYNPVLTPGVTYYISAIAGNQNAQGNVNVNDPCFSASPGIPVVFNPLPTASFGGNISICAGETGALNLNFTGSGPWTYSYTINGGAPQGPFVSNGNNTSITVNQPGVYAISSLTDSQCVGNPTAQATVNNIPAPTAVIGGEEEVCENSGNGPEVEFTGTAPWSFTYTMGGESADSVTTFNNPYTIPAFESATYTLGTVSDANCTGAASGSIDITYIEAPTAVINGGGSVCSGQSASFTATLTGEGPWTVLYTVDGVPQPPITTDEAVYTFSSGVSGVYTVTQVTDQRCSGPGTAGDAILQISTALDGEIEASDDIICIGQPLELNFNISGNPPFDLTYAINGETFQVNGIPQNYSISLNPTEAIVAELIFVQDGSSPACSADLSNSVFIQVSELPNAPVLRDDTICAGVGPTAIGVPSAPGLTYSWTPTTGLSDPNISNPQVTLVNEGLSPKSFKYILTASNGLCFASDTMTITVDPGPRARFLHSPTPASAEDPVVFFLNRSIFVPGTQFFWDFAGLGSSTAFSPEYKFPDGREGSYQVTLTAIDPVLGCSDTYTARVEVEKELLVYVPNAFTPDGDGKNELWGPVMTNIDPNDYRLTVFDRTGRIVFETRNVKERWNGGLMNGDYYLEPGLYVWTIEGREIGALDEFEMTGTVVLLR